MQKALLKCKTIIVYIMIIGVFFMCACSSTTGNVTDRGTEANSEPREYTVYIPETPGTDVVGNSFVKVDLSNKDEGYIGVKYLGDNEKTKMQIVYDSVIYTYVLTASDEYAIYPLTCGDGNYTINVY